MSSVDWDTPASPESAGMIEVITLAPALRRASSPRRPSMSRDAGIRRSGMTRRMVARVTISAEQRRALLVPKGVPF